MKKLKNSLLVFTLLLPASVLAAQVTLKSLMSLAADYLNTALELLMGFAVVMFVWYIVQYFIRSADKDRGEAGQYLLWSLIGFFIILSFWGLVNVIASTFQLNTSAPSVNSIKDLFPR